MMSGKSKSFLNIRKSESNIDISSPSLDSPRSRSKGVSVASFRAIFGKDDKKQKESKLTVEPLPSNDVKIKGPLSERRQSDDEEISENTEFTEFTEDQDSPRGENDQRIEDLSEDVGILNLAKFLGICSDPTSDAEEILDDSEEGMLYIVGFGSLAVKGGTFSKLVEKLCDHLNKGNLSLSKKKKKKKETSKNNSNNYNN
jgi:hypothetical protein